MRSNRLSAAALGATIILGSVALQPCAAEQSTPTPDSRPDKPAAARPSVKLDTNRRVPRRFWTQWPNGYSVRRPWPYIDPRGSSRNYWIKWNAPTIHRDPNVYVLYSYGNPLFVYPVPYPQSLHRLPAGL